MREYNPILLVKNDKNIRLIKVDSYFHICFMSTRFTELIIMISAIILVNVKIGYIEHVLKELRKVPNVKWISATAGLYDLIIRVEVETPEDLFDLTSEIHKVEGIERTNTHVVEKEISVD